MERHKTIRDSVDKKDSLNFYKVIFEFSFAE